MGGGRNDRFATCDSHSSLHEALRLIRGPRKPSHSCFLQAESFYSVDTRAEDCRDGDPEEDFYARCGGRSLHRHSRFLHLIQGGTSVSGLSLPDEPEAALSPQRQLTLLCELHRLSRAGAQPVLATHAPILTGLPGASLLSLDGGAIHPVAYENTEGYRVTEMFINHREALLRQLLED